MRFVGARVLGQLAVIFNTLKERGLLFGDAECGSTEEGDFWISIEVAECDETRLTETMKELGYDLSETDEP